MGYKINADYYNVLYCIPLDPVSVRSRISVLTDLVGTAAVTRARCYGHELESPPAGYRDTARFIKLAHLLSFLDIKEQSAVILNYEIRPWLDLCSLRTAPPRAIFHCFRFIVIVTVNFFRASK